MKNLILSALAVLVLSNVASAKKVMNKGIKRVKTDVYGSASSIKRKRKREAMRARRFARHAKRAHGRRLRRADMPVTAAPFVEGLQVPQVYPSEVGGQAPQVYPPEVGGQASVGIDATEGQQVPEQGEMVDPAFHYGDGGVDSDATGLATPAVTVVVKEGISAWWLPAALVAGAGITVLVHYLATGHGLFDAYVAHLDGHAVPLQDFLKAVGVTSDVTTWAGENKGFMDAYVLEEHGTQVVNCEKVGLHWMGTAEKTLDTAKNLFSVSSVANAVPEYNFLFKDATHTAFDERFAVSGSKGHFLNTNIWDVNHDGKLDKVAFTEKTIPASGETLAKKEVIAYNLFDANGDGEQDKIWNDFGHLNTIFSDTSYNFKDGAVTTLQNHLGTNFSKDEVFISPSDEQFKAASYGKLDDEFFWSDPVVASKA